MRHDATSLRTQQGHPLARQVHHHLRSFLAPLLPTPATWMRPLGVRRRLSTAPATTRWAVVLPHHTVFAHQLRSASPAPPANLPRR
jgi:hypothetical protein